MDVITFAESPAPGAEMQLPLVPAGRGRVDLDRTLEALRAVGEPRPILLEEKYIQEREGLSLLLRLRMSTDLPASRWPVYVRLCNPLEAHIRHHAKYGILCSEGVALLSEGEGPEGVPVPVVLDDTRLLQVLEQLPIRPQGDGSRHDLANRWGPLRLWSGLQALLPPAERAVTLPGWVDAAYRRLLVEEPYAYLLALADLRRRVRGATAGTGAAAGHDAWTRWRAFLDGYTGTPMRVLLLDDEIGRGWGEAVRATLERTGVLEVDTGLDGVDFDAERTRVDRHMLGSRWDLVLADLRTSGADRTATPRPGVAHLLGARAIGRIKNAHPDTTVVVFTASNKAWSVQELRDLGADGYWTKEGPEFGVDEAFSREHAAALLDTIRVALERRIEARPVWALRSDLDRLAGVQNYKRGWANWASRSEMEVGLRLKSVLDRLSRVYGFLVMSRSEHEETHFALRRYDLAFLALWGVINEVGELYFEDPAYAGPLAQMSEAVFARRSPATGVREVYWHLRRGAVVVAPNSVPKALKGVLCPTPNGQPDWPRAGAETARIAWLLDSRGEQGLASRFNQKRHAGRAGLRELRNNLEEAHGRTGAREEANLGDVHAMCAVWRALLVDPYP